MGLQVNPSLKKYTDDLVAAALVTANAYTDTEAAAALAAANAYTDTGAAAALAAANAYTDAEIAAAVPAGTMFIWPEDTAPDGWLLCYGQEISRSTYAVLFGIIGTTFGIGNGTTTFNLPDLRGRLPLGQDDMGGTPANRITNVEADSIGGSAGAENHTLVAGEMPSHTHVIGTTSGTGAPRPTTSDDATSNPVDTGSAGGGGAHNNVQPYLTTNYIIKY